MEKPVSKVEASLVTCKQCGADFPCGSGIPDKPCWCNDLPKIIPVPDAADSCLCPACVKTLIESQLKKDD